jgi:leader peptidase (prepilin peptidase)/N-methyltransferase
VQPPFDIVAPWQWQLLAGVFGALWGSFANVVIVRWPREMSVIRPGSHCLACGAPVRFYDNVPVLSYLVLRGRCRDCKARFSPRYALVELAMAVLAVSVARLTLLAEPASFQQAAAEFFVWFAFVFALVTVAMIDVDCYLIPDAIALPGIAIGIAANAFVLPLGWMEPLASAAAGYLLVRLVFIEGYRLLTGRPGMGEGDAKLLAMIGAFAGFRGGVFSLFAGAIQGLAVGSIVVLLRRRSNEPEPVFDEDLDEGAAAAVEPARFRKARVPFGPFLALGALEYLFFGERLVSAYTAALDALTRALF